MKNKISTGRLSFSVKPRSHGNVRAWVKPAFAQEKSRRSIEGNLRWEDDGGPASKTGNPLPPVVEANNPRRMYAAE